MSSILMLITCVLLSILCILFVFVFDDFVFDRYFTNKLRSKLGIER